MLRFKRIAADDRRYQSSLPANNWKAFIALAKSRPGGLTVGVGSLSIGSWMGLFAPAGTPPAIVETVFAAARAAAEDPDVRRAAAAEGMFVSTSRSPAEFKAFVEKDSARLTAAVKLLGIKPE